MDRVRYVMAVVAWISVPQAALWWFLVHPFIDFWRRVGKAKTFAFLAVFYLVAGYALWRVRTPILAVEYGTYPVLWIPALGAYALAIYIQIRIRRQLSFSVMAGAPELEPDGRGGTLLDQGLYARVRHPRYIAVLLGMVAWALFTNYLALYVMVPALAVALGAIARLEERELADRFGEPYERYRARTPMFIPRSGSS